MNPAGQLMKSLHGPVYRSRQKRLVAMIQPHLQDADRVLDVGCGNGQLGRALMEARPGVTVTGLERRARPGVQIDVSVYDGLAFPFADNAFDVVIVADVVHHDTQPLRVLAECLRVARRIVILKDHKTDGPAITLPFYRICLMDWAANVQYGIACMYDYPTHAGWHQRFAQLGTGVVEESRGFQLYPRPYRWFFTPRLQYFAVLDAAK